MNSLLLASGIFASVACIGHFSIGSKQYIQPIMKSNADTIPKWVMMSLFHYMTAFMLLSTFVLLAFSLGYNLIFTNQDDVIIFISLSYIGLFIAQISVAIASRIKNGVAKLFQWVFWLVIAVLALLSLYIK